MTEMLLDYIKQYIENADEDSKKNFFNYLNVLIDYRFAALIKNYKVSNMENLFNIVESFNRAPEPPINMENVDVWVEKYKEWYQDNKNIIYSIDAKISFKDKK
jgi:hypothetical protein